MTKVLALAVVLMMVAHVIKPLGLPGLRQRRDFWKLAFIALAAISAAALLSHIVTL